ncbi:MAG: hypothetical protein ACR2ID_12435 [Chthoniobacterales bacterium]
MKPVLAVLAGAVAFFLWEFVAHTFTPLGEAGLDYLPRTESVSSTLQSSIGAKAGMYLFPTGGLTTDSSREEKQKGMERMNEEMKTQPTGLLIYKPAGSVFHFGRNLAVQFGTDLAKAALIVALLAHIRPVSFARRIGFVVLAGFLAGIVTNIPYWNWYGFTGAFTLANILMEIIGFFFAGLAIAALYRPAPVRS